MISFVLSVHSFLTFILLYMLSIISSDGQDVLHTLCFCIFVYFSVFCLCFLCEAPSIFLTVEKAQKKKSENALTFDIIIIILF